MKYVFGNWKMHGGPSDLWTWQENFNSVDGIETCLFLPFTILHTQPMTFKVGAQDVSTYEGQGAYTGEISADMVKDTGARYVLCGHSERRHLMDESNATVKQKIENVVRTGLKPVLCVGEPLDVREAGQEFDYVQKQIEACWPSESMDQMIIAYEPVWAIGTGKVASIEQIRDMHAFINKCLKTLAPSQNMAILYGGSVKPDNAAGMISIPHVDGFLVGGASLKASDFQLICEASI